MAFVVTAIVINLTLLVRMKHGTAPITRLTRLPYYVIMALLLGMLVEESCHIILNMLYGSKRTSYKDIPKIIYYVLATASICKWTLMITLIWVRTFENEAMLAFLFFQRKFRLESLDVARDAFKRLELRLSYGFIALFAFVISPMLLQLPVLFFADMDDLAFAGDIYFTGLLTMTIAAYSNSTSSLIINIYKSHRLAFGTHIKSLVGLFSATVLSLTSFLILQLINSRYIVCSYGSEPMNGIPEEIVDPKSVQQDSTSSFDIVKRYQSQSSNQSTYCGSTDYSPKPDSDIYTSYGWFEFYILSMVLLPVFIFMILNDPHDCYKCLGKDPDRVYSRFQLNLMERTRRILRAKYNKRESEARLSTNTRIMDLISSQRTPTDRESAVAI